MPEARRVIDLLPAKASLRLLAPDTGRAPTSVGGPKVRCSTCHLRDSCLPVGLTERELDRIDQRLVKALQRVPRGEALFQAGGRFDALYQIWTGVFKTVITTRQGHEQVTGFQMGGDLIGVEGISTGRHDVDAIALEDSQVCVISYATLEALGREIPPLQQQFHRSMSREIVNDHRIMLQLGSMHAEERVAAFLLDLTDRLGRRGFSASSVLLRMTREEIGSYLGLKLETVSRTFSKLQASGLVFVRQRQIQITDPVGLRLLLDGATA